MSRSARRELETRIVILLAHLLKWRFQPERAGASWRRTIREQRWAVLNLIEQQPSLRPEIGSRIAMLYPKALRTAVREAPMLRGIIPAECPFDIDEVLDPGYLPPTERS